MLKKRVAVLRGGPSTEHDVSLQTGAGVIEALKTNGHAVKDVIISRAGEWLVDGFVRTPEQVVHDIDVVFIALHGSYGEDGTVQRILDRYQVPYTGSGAYASGVAMNKHLTKEHLKNSGIALAKSMKLTSAGVANAVSAVDSIVQLFGPEYVVKPLCGGSSIDTRIIKGQSALLGTVTELLAQYDEILIEERIIGREATAGILENFRASEHYQLPVIEIVPPAKSDFFSADVKYSGETEEICPGRFSAAEKEALSNAAEAVHRILGLQQYSRSDFIVTSDEVYFLEVNTLPGLTSESLFPKSMIAIGSNYNELIEHLIQTARV